MNENTRRALMGDSKEQEEKFEMYLPAMEKFVVNACPRCGKKPKVIASLDHFDIVDKIIYTVTRTAACEKCGISADLDAWNRLSWRGDDDQS